MVSCIAVIASAKRIFTPLRTSCVMVFTTKRLTATPPTSSRFACKGSGTARGALNTAQPMEWCAELPALAEAAPAAGGPAVLSPAAIGVVGGPDPKKYFTADSNSLAAATQGDARVLGQGNRAPPTHTTNRELRIVNKQSRTDMRCTHPRTRSLLAAVHMPRTACWRPRWRMRGPR